MKYCITWWYDRVCWRVLRNNIPFNTLKPRYNGCHLPDEIFKCVFLNKNVWISIEISLWFVPHGPVSKIAALVQILAWGPPGDQPLSEPMVANLPMHICVTRPDYPSICTIYHQKHHSGYYSSMEPETLCSVSIVSYFDILISKCKTKTGGRKTMYQWFLWKTMICVLNQKYSLSA